jgi:alanine racemase
MTHLVSSEIQDDPLNKVQLKRFDDACAGLPRAPRSMLNSSGMFLWPRFAFDLARPGAALYGINPNPRVVNPMTLPVRLTARVVAVREIGTCHTVGYNATWQAPGSRRIATAAIGYADGLHRSLSNRGHALFDGTPVPLVGRVSMDLTTYDVTARPEIGVGDHLELIGPSVPPDLVAEAAGTNGYEVLTSLGRRFARVYRGA